jgi:hypothetical protein
MGPALSWLEAARGCFRDESGGLTRGLLTSAFGLVVGLPRLWHLEQMEDPGFALLTGGRRCPSRRAVGSWRRHLPWYEVEAFCRRTSPWHLIDGEVALVSYDEHTVPRWTHKFHIKKGYVTTRNKHMRCEKPFYTYDHEPGPYVGAPPKEIRLAETATVLKGERAEQAVRTVICREVVPGPKKDRWHPLFTTSLGAPPEVLGLFRRRQLHEQAYRVGVWDEGLDAVPCGYDKRSPDPKRPRSQRGPLQMLGWRVALVYNAVADLGAALGADYRGSHVGTLRRMFFNRPGTAYQTPQALLVHLDPFRGQEALTPVIDSFNAAGHRLPWLGGRPVVLSLTPQGRAGPSPPIVNN